MDAMMAGLFALAQELLPMILPGSVQITRAADIRPASPLLDTADRITDEPRETRGPTERPARRSRSFGRDKTRPAVAVEQPDNAYGDFYEGGEEYHRTTRTGLDGPDGAAKPSAVSSPPSPPPRLRLPGVSMRDALVHKSDRMCATILTVKPTCSTVVFHNAEQECIVYAVSGTAILATLAEDHDAHDDSDSTVPPPPPARHVLGPGDFAYVPAWVEHQVVNESTDTEVVWVVVRSGPEPTVVPLAEWGGPEAS